MQLLKKSRWLLVFTAFALVLAACGNDDDETTTTAAAGDTTTTTAAGGDTTTTAAPEEPAGTFSTYISEPEHLSPPQSNESEGIAVMRAVFKGLVDYDVRTSEPRNQVAESIESTDGGKTYTITLKPGWTFHDGEAVTAESFVKAWNYTAYGPNAAQNGGFMAGIVGYADLQCGTTKDADGNDVADCEAQPPAAEEMSGLTVVDDLTFTVETDPADSQLPIKLGYSAYYPLPSVFYDDPVAFEEAPIGNGPFMMDGVWEHDIEIKTVVYPDYAGDEKPKAGGITFAIYADINTAYNDLLAGNLDIMDTLPSEQLEAARAEFGDRFGEAPTTSFNYLGFPTYVDELESADLRKALSMAIDREAITTAIFNGARQPAFSIIPPSLPGFRDEVCENWTYSPDKAKEMYDAAGGYPGGVVTVWFNSGANHDAWIEAVSNMWRETLGITEVKFEQLEFAEYLPKLDEQGLTGPFRLGWGMDYPSPQNFLEPLFASYSTPPAASNNTFYNNPDFDQAIADANAEVAAAGLESALSLYQGAEDLLCEDVPIAPMFFGQTQFAHSERVSGVYVDAFSDINYTEIEVVG